MKTKFLAGLLLTAALVCVSKAQQLPNVSYNALLNSTCASATAFCTGSANPVNPGVSGLTGPALDINSQNYAVTTVSVSGTYTGATINFEFSDQTAGTNYYSVLCTRTDVNIIELNEVLPSNGVRAWQCPVIATTRFRVRLSALGSGSVNAWITITQTSIDPSPTEVAIDANVVGTTDPCQNTQVQKSSVAINISTATTTQLVALSGTTTIYVCGFTAAAGAGTNPSFQLEYGTGASCGTGTTVLTGAMATGVTVSATAPGPIFSSGSNNVTITKTASGNALCAVTGGTTPNFQGYLTFVQQ